MKTLQDILEGMFDDDFGVSFIPPELAEIYSADVDLKLNDDTLIATCHKNKNFYTSNSNLSKICKKYGIKNINIIDGYLVITRGENLNFNVLSGEKNLAVVGTNNLMNWKETKTVITNCNISADNIQIVSAKNGDKIAFDNVKLDSKSLSTNLNISKNFKNVSITTDELIAWDDLSKIIPSSVFDYKTLEPIIDKKSKYSPLGELKDLNTDIKRVTFQKMIGTNPDRDSFKYLTPIFIKTPGGIFDGYDYRPEIIKW